MTNGYFNSKPDSVFSAARNVLSDDVQSQLTEATDQYYLLPGNVINNELYVAVRDLNAIQSTLKNGDDFDLKGFKRVISTLNNIAKEAKAFKVGTEPPVSYQYRARTSYK